MIRQMWCCYLLLVCLVSCGCGRSVAEKKYPLSGTVTLDGEPLAEAEIYLLTKETGDVDSVSVRNGTFEGEAKPGNRRVEIRAYREGEPVAPMPGAEPEPSRVNYIPARYNAESTLTAEVTPEGPNQFTFELTSDGSEEGATTN